MGIAMTRRFRLWKRILAEWSGIPRSELIRFAAGYGKRNGLTTFEALQMMTFQNISQPSL